MLIPTQQDPFSFLLLLFKKNKIKSPLKIFYRLEKAHMCVCVCVLHKQHKFLASALR